MRYLLTADGLAALLIRAARGRTGEGGATMAKQRGDVPSDAAIKDMAQMASRMEELHSQLAAECGGKVYEGDASFAVLERAIASLAGRDGTVQPQMEHNRQHPSFALEFTLAIVPGRGQAVRMAPVAQVVDAIVAARSVKDMELVAVAARQAAGRISGYVAGHRAGAAERDKHWSDVCREAARISPAPMMVHPAMLGGRF